MTSDVSAAPQPTNRNPRAARLLPPGLRQALAPRAAGVVYALVLLLVVLTIASSQRGGPFYLSSVNISNIFDQMTFVGILAIFMTVVLITGNFDLSVASTAALSGTVAVEIIDEQGTFVAVLVALLLGVVVGAVNALLVQKVGVNAFIVTLGTLTAVRGLVQVILNGQSITASNQALLVFSTKYWSMPQGLAIGLGVVLLVITALLCLRRRNLAVLGKTQLVWVPGLALLSAGAFRPLLLNERLSVWIMLVLTIVVSAVLRFTVVGRNVYAVGGNAEAARLSGINVDRYKMGAFVLNGLMAAAVGVLYAGKFNSVDPTVLTGTELTVIAAAVLGGTSLFGGSGYVVKSVIGALILFTLSNGFNVLNIGANYQNVVQGGVLIAAASLYTATSARGRGFLTAHWRRVRTRQAVNAAARADSEAGAPSTTGAASTGPGNAAATGDDVSGEPARSTRAR
jgi:D-xylose transport system permease protein